MAIVKDYYIGQLHVRIDDDCYADCTPEEIERRKQRARDTLTRVVRERNLKIEEAKRKSEDKDT